jgi:hypothetical protein
MPFPPKPLLGPQTLKSFGSNGFYWICLDTLVRLVCSKGSNYGNLPNGEGFKGFLIFLFDSWCYFPQLYSMLCYSMSFLRHFSLFDFISHCFISFYIISHS